VTLRLTAGIATSISTTKALVKATLREDSSIFDGLDTPEDNSGDSGGVGTPEDDNSDSGQSETSGDGSREFSNDELTACGKQSDLPNTPCACHAHQGCCRNHNSIRLAVPWKRQKSQWRVPKTKSTIINDVGLESDFESDSKVIVDSRSVYTLAPVHRYIQQHLSYDHIVCARQQLDKQTTQTTFIHKLSGRDDASQGSGCRFDSLSEVYFDRGTFLQRQ
jgi:hypothetical protein